MTPSKISQHIISERVKWIRTMTENIRTLPLNTYDEFISDNKNIAAAESYLRRTLEALFDLGRHILAKGLGVAVTEYKQTAAELEKKGVLDKNVMQLLLLMAGYRNRMVHYYNEISDKELFEICSSQLSDVETVVNAIIDWTKKNSDKIDKSI